MAGRVWAIEGRMEGRVWAMEERMEGRVGAMEGRMEGRVGAMEGRMEGRVGAMEGRMGGRMVAVEGRMKGRVGMTFKSTQKSSLLTLFTSPRRLPVSCPIIPFFLTRFFPHSLQLPSILVLFVLISLHSLLNLSMAKHPPLPAHPCPSLPIPAHPCPSLPIPAPPCPSLPLPASPCLSLPLLAAHPLSNPTTNDYDVSFYVYVSLTDSCEPTSLVIKKGADVTATVASSSTRWTNRESESTGLDKELPPPSPPPSYTYETNGAWRSVSTLTADNGQTYKELVGDMLAAPDVYSALDYTKTFENGAASGAFFYINKGGGE
ncbi:unnamed protein product [Closterium sp. Naga37s-1]|nr:unnamed protein product [Closterium sp. Naga37s-1]